MGETQEYHITDFNIVCCLKHTKLKGHLIKELGKYFKDIHKQMSPNYQIN